MTKFKTFDKANLKALRAELDAVLAKYGMETNLEISVGNMKFSQQEVEIKVSAKIKGAKTFSNAVLESRVAALGLNMTNSKGYTLVDYRTSNHKYPFIYSHADGKMFKGSEEYIKMLFGKVQNA